MSQELSFTTPFFELSIAIDSSDLIYKIRAKAKDASFEKPCSSLKELLLEQPVSKALASSAKELGGGRLQADWLLFVFKFLIKKFQGSDHAAGETKGYDSQELICRCMALDKQALRDSFTGNKGNFKKALLETKASMICSSCASDVEAVYEEMSFENLEEIRTRVAKNVQKALEEFQMMCPPDYDQLSFEVASVKGEKVKIRAKGERKGLGRMQIKKTLDSFLGKETLEGMEISVFF